MSSAHKIVSPEDSFTVSGTDYYTTIQSIFKGETIAMQGHYTSGTGTVVMQFSLTQNDADFQDITSTSQIVSGTGKYFFDVVKTASAYCRLHFNGASGTVTRHYNCKA